MLFNFSLCFYLKTHKAKCSFKTDAMPLHPYRGQHTIDSLRPTAFMSAVVLSDTSEVKVNQ